MSAIPQPDGDSRPLPLPLSESDPIRYPEGTAYDERDEEDGDDETCPTCGGRQWDCEDDECDALICRSCKTRIEVVW